MFDAKFAEAGKEIATADIPEGKIRKIIANSFDLGMLYGKVRFQYEDGSQTTIYDKGCNRGFEQVREIPDGYYIVGVYGRLRPNYFIYRVGFIVAKFE